MTSARTKPKKGRSPEEAVSYAVGHRIRIEILAALHEGPASAKELSQIVRQPLSTVTHHIDELHKSGSIEVARTETVGNVIQNFYCVATLPYYSDEDASKLSEEERKTMAALILQASMAEALASFWAGKLTSDPRVMMAWNRFLLDEQGRDELADEQLRSWKRIEEIEAEAAARRLKSEEPGVSYIVTSFGFQRSRNSAPEPATPGSAVWDSAAQKPSSPQP